MATRESTRTRLLDAADALVFRQGVVATPVDAILERAAASPATLYRAFGSKEGLVAAALERRHAQWLQVWDAAVDAARDERERLLAVFDAVEEFRARPEGARWCAFLGTAAEYAQPPAVLAEALTAESATMRARLHHHAVPLAGPRAEWLAAAMMTLVSGELAMRLREGAAATPHPGAPSVAREIASELIASLSAGS